MKSSNNLILEQIRAKIELQFAELLKKGENLTFPVRTDAYGHAAGDSIENWLKKHLSEMGWTVYFANEFLTEIFPLIGPDRDKLNKFLNNIWWGNLKIHKKGQIDNFIKGNPIGTNQQAGADIVLFYGKDLKSEPEKVILINAKSHKIVRNSRAPNIMSAQRLLENINNILSLNADMFYDIEYWFLGVDYIELEPGLAKAESINIKDLFRIDTSAISQINFDAAIQIQFNVRDIPEIDQTRIQFLDRISKLFIDTWKRHAERKSEKYEKLVNEIKDKLSKLT